MELRNGSQSASRRGLIQHLIKSAASIKISALSGGGDSLQTRNYSIKLPEFLVLDRL